MNSWSKYGVAGLRVNDFQYSFEAPSQIRDEIRERLENDPRSDRQAQSEFAFEDRMMENSVQHPLEMMKWMIG